MTEAWHDANLANWNERVGVHLASPMYTMQGLRAGHATFDPIVEAELGPVAGKRVLHLQCHFGADTLALAQRGADVVGLDFSPPAIDTARQLAAELGLADQARFVVADLYDAPAAVPGPAGFDLVFVTWGALPWLPDVRRWAEIAAGFVRPGGDLYLAEGHPAALVFDDETATDTGLPGYYAPYFLDGALVIDDSRDYADPAVVLENTRTHQFMHPVGSVVSALIDQGLTLQFLHEHDSVCWRMFACLVEGADGQFRWPDRRWLPLSYSLRATRPAAGVGKAVQTVT